jgi:hypothetical protein
MWGAKTSSFPGEPPLPPPGTPGLGHREWRGSVSRETSLHTVDGRVFAIKPDVTESEVRMIGVLFEVERQVLIRNVWCCSMGKYRGYTLTNNL